MNATEVKLVDTVRLRAYDSELRSKLAEVFGARNGNGDPAVEAVLVDRTRYERLLAMPVPYAAPGASSAEHLTAMERVVVNLCSAAQQASLLLEHYRYLIEDKSQRSLVGQALRNLVFDKDDKPITLEENWGFLAHRPDWHRWVRRARGQAESLRFKAKGSLFSVNDDLDPFVVYVNQSRAALVENYGEAIQAWAVVLICDFGLVYCLVKMSDEEIAQLRERNRSKEANTR